MTVIDRGMSKSRRAWSSEAWLPLGGGVAVLVLVVVCNWPGRINADTRGMVLSMEQWELRDWHSPILMAMWKPFYEVGVGLGGVLLGQVALFYAAVWAILRHLTNTRLQATALAVGTCVFPPIYGMLISDIRDTWFLAFTGAALAALVVPVSTRVRIPLVVVSSFLLFASRQNGLAVVPVLVYASLLGTFCTASPWRRRALRSALALLAVPVFLVATAGLHRVLGVAHTQVQASTPQSDLVRLTLRSGEQKVPVEANPRGVTAKELRRAASPLDLDPVFFSDPPLLPLPSESSGEAIVSAWRSEVRSHPLEYLQMRWQLFSAQVGLGHNTRNPFLPAEIAAYGFGPRFDGLADLATRYLLVFNGGSEWWVAGWVHRSWPLLLVTAMAGVLAAMRRHGSPLVVVIALTSSAYVASLFFLAPSVQFRYAAPTIFLGVLAGIALFFPWRDARFAACPAPRVHDLDSEFVDVRASRLAAPEGDHGLHFVHAT